MDKYHGYLKCQNIETGTVTYERLKKDGNTVANDKDVAKTETNYFK